MLLYRIAKTKHIHKLDGEGARLHGGRWNPKGIPVLYFGDSTALATLETIVHSPLNLMPKDRSIIILEMPDELNLTEINTKDLPEQWWTNPAPIELAHFGKKFVESGDSVAMVVPSAITPQGEGRNYILNPLHPDFSKIKVVEVAQYNYNQRLFERENTEVKPVIAPVDAVGTLSVEELGTLESYLSRANKSLEVNNILLDNLKFLVYQSLKVIYFTYPELDNSSNIIKESIKKTLEKFLIIIGASLLTGSFETLKILIDNEKEILNIATIENKIYIAGLNHLLERSTTSSIFSEELYPEFKSYLEYLIYILEKDS